jgi:Bacterial SH3 domain
MKDAMLRRSHAVLSVIRTTPDTNGEVIAMIPKPTIVQSAAGEPRGVWYSVSHKGNTSWVHGANLSVPDTAAKSTVGSNASIVYDEYKAGKIARYNSTFGLAEPRVTKLKLNMLGK